MAKSAVALRMSETGSNSADTASLRGLPGASANLTIPDAVAAVARWGRHVP